MKRSRELEIKRVRAREQGSKGASEGKRAPESKKAREQEVKREQASEGAR